MAITSYISYEILNNKYRTEFKFVYNLIKMDLLSLFKLNYNYNKADLSLIDEDALIKYIKNGELVFSKDEFVNYFGKNFFRTQLSSYNKLSYYIIKVNEKKGIISIDGEILLPIKYDKFKKLELLDTFLVKESNKWKVIDLNENLIDSLQFDEIKKIKYGEWDEDLYALKVYKNNKVGIMDYGLKFIVPIKYDDIFYDDNFDLFGIVEKNNIGLLLDGEEIFYPSYEMIKEVYKIEEKHYFLTEIESKFGIWSVNESKFLFNQFWSALHGGWKSQNGEKYGLIDICENKIISECIFDEIKSIEGDKFIFKLESKYGIFDKTKGIIIENHYDKIEIVSGKIFLYKGNKFSIFSNDKEILSGIDSYKKDFMNYLLIEKSSKWAILRDNYNVNFLYDEIKYSVINSIFIVRKNKYFGIVDEFNKVIIPFIFKEIISNRILHYRTNMYGKDLTLEDSYFKFDKYKLEITLPMSKDIFLKKISDNYEKIVPKDIDLYMA